MRAVDAVGRMILAQLGWFWSNSPQSDSVLYARIITFLRLSLAQIKMAGQARQEVLSKMGAALIDQYSSIC